MGTQKVNQIAFKAKQASFVLAGLPSDIKNQALLEMGEALENNVDSILEANDKDLQFANKEGISGALLTRLALNKNKVKVMIKGIRSVVNLPDPVGQKTFVMEIDKDLILHREGCPIGVIGAIFESRPDAVPQISSLCLKSGNSVVLKGGREAQHSNKAIFLLIKEAISKIDGFPQTAVQMIETRSEVTEMLEEQKNIHLLVPRGSNEFVRYIEENTKIPVLGHSEGICHVFVDDQMNLEKTTAVVLDSKIEYPAACNSLETLLIHKDVALSVLPKLAEKLMKSSVDLLGCENTCRIFPKIKLAEDIEWDTEYTDLKLSIKIVTCLDEAIAHINTHGSGHTDTIMTENKYNAERFLNEVDSASVMVNASTRFADGFRYGLGAEIGISTNKTHARGPVGLEGLVIYKYKLVGNGQTVAEYSGENGRDFMHRRIS